MPSAHIINECQIERSSRVMQLEGIFDVAPSKTSRIEWDVDLQLPEKWNVGVIVGPSGAGKPTVARALFGDYLRDSFEWPENCSIVDAFPDDMSIKQITGLLSSVGFSTPPAWLRPFSKLSNGEQFRVHVARVLAESSDLAVIDEFTSVVDRTVAQIGSAAIAKTVRRADRQFVAVTCHYDVLDWLEPDWVYEPHTQHFYTGRGLHRRPSIELEIMRVDTSAWRLFRQHHYLNTSIVKGAKCFVALYKGAPIAFGSVISFPHPKRPGWREHRTVCLPDFQGVGIGNALSERIAKMMIATGKPYFSNTGNPAMIHYRSRSSLWRMSRAPSRTASIGKTSSKSTAGMRSTVANNRYTAGFEYVGEPDFEGARAFGLL